MACRLTSWPHLLALVAVALPAQGYAAEPFEPALVDSKLYTESWTAVAGLADNVYVHVSLLVSNAGLKNGRGLCRAKRLAPGRPAEIRELTVERDAWHVDQGLHVGPCSLVSHDGLIRFELPLEAGTVQLTIKATPHPTPMPRDRVRHGERFYSSEVLVPFAPATVRWGTGTAAAAEAPATAFLDHSRSTTLPRDVAYGWVRFRGFAPGCSRLVLTRYVTPAKGAEPAKLESMWWKEGEAEPRPIAAPSAALPALGTPAPLRITMFDGNNRAYVLRATRALGHEAPFAEHGLMGRLVGAVVGSVDLESFDAVLEDGSDGPCKQVAGVMEVDHLGD